MSLFLARILLGALALAPCAVYAQDPDPYGVNKPKSQQDILREKENACKGYKGEAHTECLNSYVGPKVKSDRGTWKRPANPARRPGRA